MKKFLSVLMVIALSVFMAMPVMAEDTDTITSTEASSQGVKVTATLESNYVVHLPAAFLLDPVPNSNDFQNTYAVKVTGNLAHGSYVSVEPNAEFKLKDKDSDTEVTAAVEQTIVKWAQADDSSVTDCAALDEEVTGTVTTTIIKDGVYEGQCIFTYQMHKIDDSTSSGSNTPDPSTDPTTDPTTDPSIDPTSGDPSNP